MISFLPCGSDTYSYFLIGMFLNYPPADSFTARIRRILLTLLIILNYFHGFFSYLIPDRSRGNYFDITAV